MKFVAFFALALSYAAAQVRFNNRLSIPFIIDVVLYCM